MIKRLVSTAWYGLPQLNSVCHMKLLWHHLQHDANMRTTEDMDENHPSLIFGICHSKKTSFILEEAEVSKTKNC